jgi:hypothetical protein
MTKFLATPLAMTQEFFGKTYGYGDVGTPQDYVERQTVEVDAIDVPDALCKVWEIFQNIEAPRLCPDGGRSLMVGDIIRVTNTYGENAELHRIDGVGFSPVRSLKTIFPRAVEAMQNPNLTYEDLVADDLDWAEIASEQADVDNCD